MKKDNDTNNFNDVINLHDLFLAIKKRKWIALIFFLATSFCFSLYAVIAPDIYKVTNLFILSDSALNISDSSGEKKKQDNKNMKSLVESSVASLNKMTKAQQAEILGVSKSAILTVDKFGISEVSDDSYILRVEVDTSDPKAGKMMIDALHTYVNNIPFIKEYIVAQRGMLEKNRNELTHMMKDPYTDFPMPKDAVVSDSLRSFYAFKEQFIKIELALHDLENNEIIKFAGKSMIPDQPFKPKRLMIHLLGFICGIFLSVFAVFVMELVTGLHRGQ